MKRINGLWAQMISLDNLWRADDKARRGRTNSYGVRMHDKRRVENLRRLHAMLRDKAYRTSPYDVFTVREPKEREIYRLPYFPDRIVHHAVMNVLEPIWVRTFPYNTFACVKGRGIQGCADRVRKIIDSYEGRPLYALKIDLRKFYPSIDHEIMKKIVRKKIKDKDVLWLLDEIIDSTDGLPIGNYISQYLANLYLCYFLHWVNERLPLMVGQKVEATAYADDIVFFASDKAVLHRVLALVREQVEGGLKLTIKDNYQVFPIARNRYDKSGRALDYVGYCFYRHQTLVRKRIKKNICRRVARINRVQLSTKEYKRAIAPWLGWAKHSDSRHLLKCIIKKEMYESIL